MSCIRGKNVKTFSVDGFGAIFLRQKIYQNLLLTLRKKNVEYNIRKSIKVIKDEKKQTYCRNFNIYVYAYWLHILKHIKCSDFG